MKKKGGKDKERNSNSFKDILARYILLLIFSLSNLFIFYFIFTPLTIYPVYWILSIFFDISLIGNVLQISNCFKIEIIDACVAGAAYYLLLILNLSTPNIQIKKRIKILVSSFAVLLILNIFRIILLSIFFVKGYSFFDITHKIFWYFISTIFVVGIWFGEVKYFKIKDVPFYSDLKFLFKRIKLRL